MSTLPPAADPLQAVTSWRKPDQSSAARGYGHRWRVERVEYLREHPLCVMCKDAGRVVPACVVDHVTPHDGDAALFWNRANWQSLCAHCHSSRKQREDNAQRFR